VLYAIYFILEEWDSKVQDWGQPPITGLETD